MPAMCCVIEAMVLLLLLRLSCCSVFLFLKLSSWFWRSYGTRRTS